MRGLALVVLVAACSDTGVLLDVHTDPSVASVEVFVARAQSANRMGMPPAASARATQGPVYATIDHTLVDVGKDGRARVLLQRGELTEVPAILVLGLDAQGNAASYAVVTDPSGAIQLPATKEIDLVVNLDPAAPTTIAQARMPMAGVHVARWSAESQGKDDPKGACVALLEGSNTAVAGTFFGPDGDTDCDAAQPECDDAWYLRVKDPGKCATDTDPNVDTADACRIGDSAGCRDNVASSSNTCVAQAVPPICVPHPICDQCSDLDPSCVAQNLSDENTMHVECTVDAHIEAQASDATLCANRAVSIDMSAYFGGGYSCTGSSTFVDPMSPTMPGMPDLALASGSGPRVTFTCHQLSFQLDITDPNTGTPITNNMDTHGAVLVSVGIPNDPASDRLIVVPITVKTNVIGNLACDTAGMQCALVPDTTTVPPDPMWHCTGT